MPEMAEVAPSLPPQRLSRYRSQRRAQQAPAKDAPEVPQLPQLQDTTTDDVAIARSKSRYKRKNAANGWPDIARPYTGRAPNQGQDAHRPQKQRQPQLSNPAAQLGASDLRRVRSGESLHDVLDERQPGWSATQITNRASETVPVSSLTQASSELSRPTGELFPPARREPIKPAAKLVRSNRPSTSDDIRATNSMSRLPRHDNVDDETTGGCFGWLKRRRGEASQAEEKTPIARPPTRGAESQAIKAGGVGGAIPGTDAPVSAVNAGDRHVLVECGKSKMAFPVTPTTTPVDLIKSASTCMSERIDMKSAVLLEYFDSVGVQRPLRRYEHIRDVMNGWDTDRQNRLLLVDPGTGSSEAELSIVGVPQRKPDDRSWLLMHSQTVGKWDKRLITLKSDGQITLQKDPKKPQQQDNVCHLSDFDIYTPTQEKIRNKIKPPRKLCFAIKSQQKTSMFESMQNYVHFFCTDDRATADSFYSATQAWRSWYLVNVMGEGKKAKFALESEKEHERSNSMVKGHRPSESFGSHYQLGSFRPLINVDDFEERPASSRSAKPPPSAGAFAKSAGQFDTTISPERRTSTTRKKQQHPPGTMSNKAQLADDEPLANIGRRPSVDQRRLSISGSELRCNRSRKDGQDIGGSIDLQRSGSARSAMPEKPLVDLTPEYREPPQHANKGKGHRPDRVGPGGLINSATSPEDPMGIPPSTDWRGRNAQGSSPVGPQHQSQPNRAGSISRPRAPGGQRTAASRSAEGPEAFTGEGLLAGAQQGWGGGDRGRGYTNGSHAQGPLLDVSERSIFALGSLLKRVERDQPDRPIIDREKRDEKDLPYGEGY